MLKPETVALMSKNAMGDTRVVMLKTTVPARSEDAEFFPGLSKSWSLSFMVNDEAAPTGRPAGALGWAGLSNMYFWIDRRNGLGGMWASQVFPFADPTSFGGYMDFETAVYQTAAASRAA